MKKTFLLKLIPLVTLPTFLLACTPTTESPKPEEDLQLQDWSGEVPQISSTLFPKLKTFENLTTALPFDLTTKGFIHLFQKNAITITIPNAQVTKVFLDEKDPILRSLYFVIEENGTKFKYHSRNLNITQNFLFPAYKIPFDEQDSNKLAPFGIGVKDWDKANEKGFNSLMLESKLTRTYWHIDHEHTTDDYIMEIPLRIMIFEGIDENFTKDADQRSSTLFFNQKYFQNAIILYSELYVFRYLFGTRAEFLSKKAFTSIKIFNIRSALENHNLPAIQQDDVTFGYQFLDADGNVISYINNADRGSLSLNWFIWKKPSQPKT